MSCKPLIIVVTGFLATTLAACDRRTDIGLHAQAFLEEYTARYLELYTASQEAEWASNTRIVDGDDTNRRRTEAANQALAEFAGSTEVIASARAYLEWREHLSPIQIRQLQTILFNAAEAPQTVPALVKQRIAAEARQVEDLYGFDFQIRGKPVTANEIDQLLHNENDVERRLDAWQASKEVGRGLRGGLARLVELRNGTVRALGYEDFFQYQVSEYGTTVDEMLELNERLIRDLWPLYRQLHTWARYELADRYGISEVPRLLPAHWLPDRWGQDWSNLVTVEGIDLDSTLADQPADWLVRQAESFYVSLGFDTLPASFWKLSSLYPPPADAGYKKNNHASAHHINLADDVRCLMSVEPNQNWWMTAHHELGHVYYYIAYTNPDVPPLLRRGACRAFHEAIGSLVGAASMHKAYLQGRRLVAADVDTDDIRLLLKQALDQVVFIPWSAGVMTRFEHGLYTGEIGPETYNARWWDLVGKYQGIEGPSPRDESYCDPATKTHITDDPAQYYDYALSIVILHQLHAHIAGEILGRDPHDTDYFGRKDIGAFLNRIMRVGATRDWREVLSDAVGGEISSGPMRSYFAPLMDWLEVQNADRHHSLPEEPPT